MLGNDLVGEMVIPELQVVTEQEVMKKMDDDAEATLHILPSYAVIKAIARGTDQKEPKYC